MIKYVLRKHINGSSGDAGGGDSEDIVGDLEPAVNALRELVGLDAVLDSTDSSDLWMALFSSSELLLLTVVIMPLRRQRKCSIHALE